MNRATCRRLEGRDAPIGAPRLARDRLLQQEAARRDHRQPAVAQFLLLHEGDVLRVARSQLERVEAQVARHVALAQGRGGLVGGRVHLCPALLDAEELGAADADGHRDPEPRGKLRDLVNRGSAGAREERVELLLDNETERRKHGDAAVRRLRFAQAVHLELRLTVQEARRVELAKDVGGAGEAVGKGVRRGRLGSDHGAWRRRLERGEWVR